MRSLINVPGHGSSDRYAGAAIAGGLVFTSGQVAVSHEYPDVPDEFEVEVERVLDHLEATLRAAGTSLAGLVKVTTYLACMDLFDVYNEAYLRRLRPHGLPARTTVEIAGFRGAKRIELEAVAALPRTEGN